MHGVLDPAVDPAVDPWEIKDPMDYTMNPVVIMDPVDSIGDPVVIVDPLDGTGLFINDYMGMNESIYDKTGPDEFPTSRANRLFSCRI